MKFVQQGRKYLGNTMMHTLLSKHFHLSLQDWGEKSTNVDIAKSTSSVTQEDWIGVNVSTHINT